MKIHAMKATAAMKATSAKMATTLILVPFVNKLRYLRGPGESFSDVILRLAGETPRHSAPDIGRGC
jgi:hypothetical protein